MKRLLDVVLVCLCVPLFSQPPASANRQQHTSTSIYAQAAQHELSNFDIIRLTDSLVAPYTTELEKARAIFSWLATYISYDCGNENRLFDEPDEPTHPLYYTQQQLENILKTRRTRCDGYAFMFKLMCNLAGIYCSRLEGYARFRQEKVDAKSVRPNHAWNAALLDGQWYEIDATAGSGQCAGSRFHRQLDTAYFGMAAGLLEKQYILIDDHRQTHNQGRIILKF
jgi:transglutaminase/protease-like cytokinesis protein 3